MVVTGTDFLVVSSVVRKLAESVQGAASRACGEAAGA